MRRGVRAVLGVWLLLVPALARPQSPTTSLPATTDIGRQAEEVATRLRLMSESLADTGELAALKSQLEAHGHLIAEQWSQTEHLLESRRRIAALDSLASAWLALRRQIEGVERRIASPARRVDDDLKTLSKLHDSWSASLELRRQAQVPPFAIQRTEATLASIDAMRPAVEQRHAQVLVLQDEVTRLMDTCDDALARIRETRREAMGHLLTSPGPSVWIAPWNAARPDAHDVGNDLSAAATSLRVYAELNRGGVLLTVVILLVVALLLRRARTEVEARATDDAFFARAAAVLRAPYATATLVALVLSRPLRPDPPVVLQQLSLALLMVLATHVLRPFIGPRPTVPIYGLLLGLAGSVVVASVPLAPAVEQLAIIGILALLAALLLWVTREFGAMHSYARQARRMQRLGMAVGRLLALGCGVGALAAALGYVVLAEYVGAGLLFLAFVTVALPAFRAALGALIATALVLPPLRHSRTVIRHRALIERRAETAMDMSIVVVWIVFALVRFELWDAFVESLRGMLGAGLHVGQLDVDLGQVLGFLAVVTGAYFTTRAVGLVLEDDVYSRMTLPRGVPYALSTLTRYLLLLVGFLLALGTLGLDLTRLTVLVSAFGLGIGFGLQEIINNFVSGLILLFERPVQVGDSVQLSDLVGQVLRIGVRSSTVRTAEGAEVIVPNSKLLEEKVTNWTLSDYRRRVDLDVTIGWDADSERILALLVEIAGRDPRVCAQPAPEALLVRFGDASADFQLRVWTEETHWVRVRSDLGIAVQRALRALRPENVLKPAKVATSGP